MMWFSIANVIIGTAFIINSINQMIIITRIKYERRKDGKFMTYFNNIVDSFQTIYLLVVMIEGNYIAGFRGSACFGSFL
jgi:hypothetical protein